MIIPDNISIMKVADNYIHVEYMGRRMMFKKTRVADIMAGNWCHGRGRKSLEMKVDFPLPFRTN